jgi:hypothetical protein
MTVGMPSIRLPPPGLDISTLRTTCGWYCPSLSRLLDTYYGLC